MTSLVITNMSTTPSKTESDTSQRFQQVDSEIAGVKKDISGLQFEFQTEMTEVRGDIKSLNIGQTLLQQHQAEGFKEIKDVLSERNSAPTKIGVGMLVSVIGLFLTTGVVAVGAFWAAVMLLFSPLKEDIHEHVALDGHPKSSSLLVGVERDIDSLYLIQQEKNGKFKAQVDSIKNNLDQLNHFAIEHAKEQGQSDIMDQWHTANLKLADIQQNYTRDTASETAEKISALKAQVDLLIECTKGNLEEK